MRAFVIGISGQDGGYLARFLLRKGYEVIGGSRAAYHNAFTNLSRLGILDKIQIKSISLSDFRSVLQAVSDTAPDEIYNLSGQSSVGLSFELPIETFESNTIGALNLLEVIRYLRKPVKLYNACSSECFGSLPIVAADEKTPFHPRSPYAVSKAAAYWQVSNYREAYNIFACSGILFNHESPLRPDRFVTQKIISTARRIAAGNPEQLQIGNIEIERDWGWAPEYVEAMWKMLQQSEADDYVIGTGESHSLKEFIQTTFETLGLDWHDHVCVAPDLLRPTDIQFSKSNPQKAEYRLGWKAHYRMKDIIHFMLSESLIPEKDSLAR